MPRPARTMLVVGTDVRVRADLDRLGRKLGLAVTFLDDLPRALTASESTRFDVRLIRLARRPAWLHRLALLAMRLRRTAPYRVR